MLCLRNARIIDPASGVDGIEDLLLDGGRVVRRGARLRAPGAEKLDLDGLVVCPGFIDMHVHLREPGQEWKETIISGTRSAARGGFTAVACMPNTVPPNDNRSVTEAISREARANGLVRVYVIGCVTKGQAGLELAEMGDMRMGGAVAFSDDGKPVRSSLMMRRALEYSQVFGVPIIDHCEDGDLVDQGVVHEGTVSTRLGLRGWPGVAEDVIVQRDILLAEYTGGHVHIAHMSTARAADFVRRARRSRVRVTCEVTPHHFCLTDEAIGDYQTNAKMNPPLRSEKDRRGLLKAIADGTVDAIATDHAPHHCDEKCVEFADAPFGVVGLETAVSLALDRLVHGGVIDLPRLVDLMSIGPARVLGVPGGRLAEGDPADVTVLDLERQVTVDPRDFESKGRNTPFGAWQLRGAPVLTIVDGKVVHRQI